MFYDSLILQSGNPYQFGEKDENILKGLAREVRQAAADPITDSRRMMQNLHCQKKNFCQSGTPLQKKDDMICS